MDPRPRRAARARADRAGRGRTTPAAPDGARRRPRGRRNLARAIRACYTVTWCGKCRGDRWRQTRTRDRGGPARPGCRWRNCLPASSIRQRAGAASPRPACSPMGDDRRSHPGPPLSGTADRPRARPAQRGDTAAARRGRRGTGDPARGTADPGTNQRVFRPPGRASTPHPPDAPASSARTAPARPAHSFGCRRGALSSTVGEITDDPLREALLALGRTVAGSRR